MSSIDLVNVAGREDFAARCRYAFVKAAISVLTEDAGTTQHAARVAYARDVLTGVSNATSMTFAVLSNATIAAAISGAPNSYGTNVVDGDIDFQVASVFTAFGLTKV